MNDHYPDSSDQYSTQGKLVLPAYHDATLPASEDARTTYIPMGQAPSSPYNSPVRPELLMQNYASSSYEKLQPRSRTSPAQLILVIAIIVVLVATGSVAYAAVTIFGPTLTKGNSATNSSAAHTQASATALPTATPMPTATPKPVSTFDGAPLTLTIQDLPNSVNNDDSGPVTVQTNAAGLPVHLRVTYAAPPYNYTSGIQMTDANGVATLTWNVQITPTKRKTNAQVVAVAQEPNGQQVQSDTVNVRIFR